jgi:predicted 3-demethylubiquinone-9 3-methyltransferase (glyoxalase superfamily)
MNKIVPHIWLKQDARKAARFYAKVFKDSRIISTTSFKNPHSGQVHVVTMLLLDMRIMLMSGKAPWALNESFSFVVNCHAQSEIDYYWSALTADGGEESMCGWLKDKYGLSWQIIPDAFDDLLHDDDKERFKRVEAIVLSSNKINIRDIMKAYYND